MDGYTTIGQGKQMATGAALEQQTEMDTLSALLVANLRRLREMNNMMEVRLDRFSPMPPRPAESTAPSTTEPPPGTLAFLQAMTNDTGMELARLDSLVERLRALI